MSDRASTEGRRPHRLMMSATASEMARLPAAGEPFEQLTLRHAAALGRLFQLAFAGTVEDDGRLLVDPVGDMRSALDGRYGAVVGPASLGVGSTRLLRAAVLTVLMDGGDPLIAICMTAPEWQRRGYATGLIAACSSALAEAEHERLFLAVHRDSPARRYYERLGFEPV
jgi:GNAT superfamily N-acetyltransferase